MLPARTLQRTPLSCPCEHRERTRTCGVGVGTVIAWWLGRKRFFRLSHTVEKVPSHSSPDILGALYSFFSLFVAAGAGISLMHRTLAFTKRLQLTWSSLPSSTSDLALTSRDRARGVSCPCYKRTRGDTSLEIWAEGSGIHGSCVTEYRCP